MVVVLALFVFAGFILVDGDQDNLFVQADIISSYQRFKREAEIGGDEVIYSTASDASDNELTTSIAQTINFPTVSTIPDVQKFQQNQGTVKTPAAQKPQPTKAFSHKSGWSSLKLTSPTATTAKKFQTTSAFILTTQKFKTTLPGTTKLSSVSKAAPALQAKMGLDSSLKGTTINTLGSIYFPTK